MTLSDINVGAALLMTQIAQAQDGSKLSQEEISAWDVRSREIDGWWDWFTGKALEERDQSQPRNKAGEYPLKYPLQINPVRSAARLHAYALWGETQDTSEPLVKITCQPKEDTDAARNLAAEADTAILDVEYENAARTQDLDMGLSIQSLGGMVMKVGWDPTDINLPNGVRYEYYDPRSFHCRYRGKDYRNLWDAWIVLKISKETALMYGVQLKQDGVYREYWGRGEHWIKIDDKVALNFKGEPLEGANPFGFVPFIYVPHERANDFWGCSIVDASVIGIALELNSRDADIGDYVRSGVNSSLWIANNKSGYPVRKTLEDGQSIYHLGRSLGNEPSPQMGRVQAPQLPEGADKFSARLLESARTTMSTPDIAYGKEEGTQRSGVTLYSRMWPMLAHVLQERGYWTEGKTIRAEMTLKILATMKRHEISEKHLGLRKRAKWFAMVPIDRQQLVEEVIRRRQEDAISIELMVEKFGDAVDNKIEVQRILDIEDRAAELAAKSKPQQAVTNQAGMEDAKTPGGKEE